MKQKCLWVIVNGLVLTIAASGVFAQGYGMPVIDASGQADEGYVNCAVGANMGKDVQFYGERVTTTIQKSLRLFLDFGAVNPEKGGTALAAQGGVLACLNVESPVNVAVRATLYGMPSDRMDVLGGTAMLLAGGPTIFDSLFLYSGVGLDVQRNRRHFDPQLGTVDGSPTIVTPPDVTDENVRLLWTGGAMISAAKNADVFVELTVTDKPFIGLGLRLHP